MRLGNREVIEVYETDELIGGFFRGLIYNPIDENGYWFEMTKGEKKALLIKGLVGLHLPTGNYYGVAKYKFDADSKNTLVQSKVIHFVKRGE